MALSGLFAAAAGMLQAGRRQTSRDELGFLTLWRPLLLHPARATMPAVLPMLETRHRLFFLKLWNQSMRNADAGAADGLAALARAVDCDRFCRRMLLRGERVERLLAALTLGQLRDHAAWDSLVNLTMSADGELSLQAFHAMLRIDAEAAASQSTPLLLARHDWPVAQLAAMLQPVQGAFMQPLVAALAETRAAHLPRALRLVEALRLPLPQAAVLPLLQEAHDTNVLLGALRLVRDVGLLPYARPHLRHDDWRVRVQAAKALGRVGEHADANRLIPLLGDAEWWVRYRAAQALAGMSFFSSAELELLRANLSDRYARDILGQVLAERQAA